MGAPSNAEVLFASVRDAANDRNRLKIMNNWIEKHEPETEWLDFKSAGHLQYTEDKKANDKHDDWIKGEWSKYLSAFSNTGGGILVWGISTAKHNGSDCADKLSLTSDATKLKNRLDDLINSATYPPVPGVQNLVITEPNSDKGCVVSYIPNSSHKPHRAEYDRKCYYQRVDDDCHVMPHEILRHCFHPMIAPNFIFRANCEMTYVRGDFATLHVEVEIENTGTATAKYVYVSIRPSAHNLSPREPYTHGDWTYVQSRQGGVGLQCKNPIHPKFKSPIHKFRWNTKQFEQNNGNVSRANVDPVKFQIEAYAENMPLQAAYFVVTGDDAVNKICIIAQSGRLPVE
ncbi:MAG TPA: ATP-binding protein [Phycisphaerae bacterium]|jgi:hypothetical protein